MTQGLERQAEGVPALASPENGVYVISSTREGVGRRVRRGKFLWSEMHLSPVVVGDASPDKERERERDGKGKER